ncbi:c-type cytochrome [uncultured Tateyamaria sp.]|uniref:c-type cytochrome n=1 Tax=uncultured Tateyamaria sp. TaxID=455651 RepID=UPI001DEA49BF|nr:cytochrome c [uncultured Tateyamaria sp.]MCB4379125.1 cytochrome c [Synechococcus sp. MU1644]
MRRLAAIFLVLGTPGFADHELLDRDIIAGQTLYQAQCAACHGANLEGQPNWRSPNDDGVLPAPPHDETGHTWHHDNQLLFEYTKLGGRGALSTRGVTDFNSGMPAFEGVISDDEIWDILAYIRSTWPERVQEIHANRNPPH